jgi:hypothetical protein
MVHSAGVNGSHVKVTADHVVRCADCTTLILPLAQKGGSQITSDDDDVNAEELPSGSGQTDVVCATGLVPLVAQASFTKNFSTVSNTSNEQAYFQEPESAPSVATLRQNVPNPAHDEAAVTIALPKRSLIRCTLTDTYGREVIIIAEGEYNEGRHQWSLSTKNIPSGVYVFALKTQHGVVTRTVTVIH